jgi:hypothetical protein
MKATKAIRKDTLFDETVIACNLIKYSEKAEVLYLAVREEELEALSLDVIYKIDMTQGAETLSCMGEIADRYIGKNGKTIKIKIRNGFCKISAKYVDKHIT